LLTHERECKMDRSTLYNAIVKRWHWAGKGTWLITLFYPREYWDARKRGIAAHKRLRAFALSAGYVRVGNKFVKKGNVGQ
jgi:hypothetical protein